MNNINFDMKDMPQSESLSFLKKLREQIKRGQMKIYIAGPMEGYPEHNRPAFFSAEERLKDSFRGSTILNPARNPKSKEITPAQYMDIDLAMVRTADAIYMLEGWEKSKGANVEYHYAVFLKMRIFHEVGQ